MSDRISEYIITRLRRTVPDGSSVVPGSTPVIAFGDPRKARVATLGFNPSRVEFLSNSGRELDGPDRRLETLRSLDCSDLASAPITALQTVLEACHNYFSRNPYRR